jgi:dihydrodipicolinate synthase/N-acetylneuraminate lyase
LLEHYAAGRLREAEGAYRLLMRLTTIARDFGAISGTKAALRLMGLPGGYPRKPRLDVTPEQLDQIGALIDEIKLREAQ